MTKYIAIKYTHTYNTQTTITNLGKRFIATSSSDTSQDSGREYFGKASEETATTAEVSIMNHVALKKKHQNGIQFLKSLVAPGSCRVFLTLATSLKLWGKDFSSA